MKIFSYISIGWKLIKSIIKRHSNSPHQMTAYIKMSKNRKFSLVSDWSDVIQRHFLWIEYDVGQSICCTQKLNSPRSFLRIGCVAIPPPSPTCCMEKRLVVGARWTSILLPPKVRRARSELSWVPLVFNPGYGSDSASDGASLRAAVMIFSVV